MTAIAVAGKRSGILAPLVPSVAIGPDASQVKARIEVACTHMWESVTLRHLAESAWTELLEVADAAASPNWDGYGANAVSDSAYEQAKLFLAALPTTTPIPEISVDPDGEISISWNVDSDWIFSVSIGPTGRLSYAGTFGTSTAYGTEWMVGDIPSAVLENLTRLFRSRRKSGA